MNSLSAIALSAGTAALASFVVAVWVVPQPSPARGGSQDLSWLEERIAKIEQRVDHPGPMMAKGGAPLIGERQTSDPVRREVTGAAEGAAAIAELEARMKRIERQLSVVGRDPLLRAESYLTSSSPRARREAIELLRRYAPFDPKARETIRAMLNDTDAGVRREALEAIGRTGDLAALPQVRGLLSDGDTGVRREAADAMENLLSDVPKNSSEFRAGMQALLARVGDSDQRVREEIVDAIGDLGAEGAGPALVPLLNDQHRDVREEAIQALGRSGHRAAVPQLRQIYENGPAEHRMDSAIAMARLGAPAAFRSEARELVKQVENPKTSSRQRSRAVAILGSVDPQHYRALLEKAGQDKDWRVRRAAQRALARR